MLSGQKGEASGFTGSVSLVMPTYNEAGNIADLMREAVSYTIRAGATAVEVIVVDDDSPDLTWQIAAATECPGADVSVIRRREHHGLTFSLMAGIDAARHDVVVWFDCDFSHPPDKIPQLLDAIGRGYDVAVNSRYLEGGGEQRGGEGGAMQRAFSWVLNSIVGLLLDPAFSDYTSGFAAVRRDLFHRIRLHGDYGEYFIDFIYRVLRDGSYRVCELPYVMLPRRSGESKTGSSLIQYLMRGRKYIWTVLRLRFGGR